jgi:hypothetical protein
MDIQTQQIIEKRKRQQRDRQRRQTVVIETIDETEIFIPHPSQQQIGHPRIEHTRRTICRLGGRLGEEIVI